MTDALGHLGTAENSETPYVFGVCVGDRKIDVKNIQGQWCISLVLHLLPPGIVLIHQHRVHLRLALIESLVVSMSLLFSAAIAPLFIRLSIVRIVT